MNENIEEGDWILMSSDLYQNMLIVYLAQDNILVRPVNDDSTYPIEWVSNLHIDFIIINYNSIIDWEIENLINGEGWCEILRSEHEINEYVIIEKC